MLTQTVTRVIRVIPRPVRYVIAGLGALAALLVLVLGAVGLRARRLERQRRRLVEDVGLLQSALLPELGERTGPAYVSAAYQPAAGLAAGGDFYDAFTLDEHRTCVVVGDVAGHGREAVPLTALVRYTIRAYLEGGLGPRQALQVAGRVLDPQLRDIHVTVIVAIYDVRTGLLSYASAGHPPAVVSSDEVVPVLAFASPALGLGEPTGRREVTVPLPPGAHACLFTDGLADAMKDGERVGLEALPSLLRELAPGEGAPELLQRIARDNDTTPDDMAAIVIRPPQDAPASAGGRIEELEVEASDLERGRLARYLTEYRVSDGVAAAALEATADVVRRSRTAVVAVYHDAGGATVEVQPTPDVVALPVRQPAPDALARTG